MRIAMVGSRRLWRPALGLVSLALCGVGCGSNQRGTQVGTFDITASQSANACGAKLGFADPWSFEVSLSLDGSFLYWAQAGSVMSASLDSNRRATLSTTEADLVFAKDGGLSGCALALSNTTTLTLASDESTVEGTIDLGYATADGYDCSSQLSAQGGSYDALPCEVSYAFTGTRAAK